MVKQLSQQQLHFYHHAVKRATEMGHPHPVAFARKIMAESNMNAKARSPVGAMGIAQFMPKTARGIGLVNPDDPYAAIDASVRYDLQNIKQLRKAGIEPTSENVLAAYNAGPGAVIKHKGVPQYTETLGYVEKIMSGGNINNYAMPTSGFEGYAPNGRSGSYANPQQPAHRSDQIWSQQPQQQQQQQPFQPPSLPKEYAPQVNESLAGMVGRASPMTLGQFVNGVYGRMQS